jgi:hypothetical protein
MSNYFDRVLRVYAGDPQGESIVKVDGLKIVFEAKKTERRDNNECTLTIWNMRETTKSVFERLGNSVVIEGGYENGVGLGIIFSGIIERSAPVQSGADIGLEIELSDGSNLSRKSISRTWKGKAFPGTIVRDIAISLGVDLKISEPIPKKPYNNGFSAFGGTLFSLKKVLDRVGFSYSIQNGEMRVFPKGSGDSTTIVKLSPSTGLIDYSRKINDANGRKKVSDKVGYSFKSLINPFIQPSGRVFLDSDAVVGEMRVRSVTHRGDTFGSEWESEIEAFEI